MITGKWSNRRSTVRVYVKWTFICKTYLYSHLCKVKSFLCIMWANLAQPLCYYNSLIRIITLHGAQAIRIHVYHARYYKSKHTCYLGVQYGSRFSSRLQITRCSEFSLVSLSVSIIWGSVSSQISSKSIVQFWLNDTINISWSKLVFPGTEQLL